MAAAGLAVLENCRRTNRGAHIDASMYEVCVQQMLDAILRTQSGEAPRRAGNEDSNVAHQDVYPAAGHDRWVAISCTSQEELGILQALAGGSDIAAWTSRLDAKEAAERLQDAGVGAAAVQDIED